MKVYYYFSVFLFSILILISCAVEKDFTPDAHPNAKIITSEINTLNTGSVTDSVKAGSEVVKLRLKVTSTTEIKYIYILYAADNGAFIPLTIPATTNSFGTFAAGSSGSYSLQVPGLKTFDIDVAVAVRSSTTALNDVYKIWMTGDLGSYTMSAYNRTLGSATINLMYQNASLPVTFTSTTTSLGSQSSKDFGNFLATQGQVGVMDSASYVKSPKSADISLITLTSGKKDNNSTSLWLYSPADVTQANPAVSGQTDFVLPTSETSNTTYFDTYTGTTAFDDIKATTLSSLPDPTIKSLEVMTDGLYVFKTQEGKKGVIKINSITATANYRGTGSTTAQNANVSVKVLN